MTQNRWTQLDLIFRPRRPGSEARSRREETAVETERPSRDAEERAHRQRIVGFLSFRLPEPVDVVFTNNRSTMISFARRQGRYRIRLHRLFRHADEMILEHLSRFILCKSPMDSKALDGFIATHREEILEGRHSRPRRLRATGVHHDLTVVLERVVNVYFNGCDDVRIGWGRTPRRRPRRRRRMVSRALATYSYEDRTIRVSPVLDAANVPDYVIDWIVYHEMLHHVLPVKRVKGRFQYHTVQFRALERAFKDFERAKKWEATHLEQLLG